MPKLNAILTELPDGGVLTPAMLAREYNPQSYADAFEAVEDYRQVQQRHAETGMKSTALAAELDLPRGRIRPWLNGAVPNPVRAIGAGIDGDRLGEDVLHTQRECRRRQPITGPTAPEANIVETMYRSWFELGSRV